MPRHAHTLFVTGTDTGVGKTRFTSLLVRALREQGLDAVGMKPFCCGDREDADLLYAAADGAADLALVNPVWLRVPAAPYAASLVENRLLDVDAARDALYMLRSAHEWVIVEGVGGWRVPLTADLCTSDFAAELAAPVLVVSANKLGTLNHTQLTVDAVRMRDLPCLGVVLNRPEPGDETPASITNAAVLEQLLSVPLLGEIPHGASALPDRLAVRIQTAIEA